MDNEDLIQPANIENQPNPVASTPVTPPPTPEPPTPTPDYNNPPLAPVSPNPPEKTKKPIIIGFVVVLLAIIIGVVAFLALNRNNSNSNIDYTVPDAARAEEFCNEHGLRFLLMKKGDTFSGDSKVDFSYQEEKLGVTINSQVSCLRVNSENAITVDSKAEVVDFGIYFIDKAYNASMNVKQYLASASILEDSPDFLKTIQHTDYGYAYVVAYQNTILSLGVQDTETGEKFIAELGYPNRNQADANTIEEDLASSESSVDAHNREVLTKIINTLAEYRLNNNRLPEIEGDVQTLIYGFDDSDFDIFFKNHIKEQGWFVDANGNSYYSIQATNTANPEIAADHTITIHYNATCEGEEVVSSDSPNKFAATFAKTNDEGYICVNN